MRCILTEENREAEIDKLFKELDLNPYQYVYEGFYDKLDKGFSLNDLRLGEWSDVTISSSPVPKGICSQTRQYGKVAYEFDNGFLVFEFEEYL